MNFIEKIISDELIYAIGWTMVHSLWQGFLIAILLGFAMIGLQKKSSKVRYEAAYFALFLVFITSISTFIYLYDSVATGVAINQTLIIDGSALTLDGTETVQSFFQSTIEYFNTHMPMIVTIWLMGVGFFLLRLMGGLAYVQKLKYQDQHPLADKWQTTFEKLVNRLPIRQTVRVVESGLATVPMVVGYFKPVILMPIGVVNQLTSQEVEAVLAHELAHIYRNDYVLNILQSLIEILFYYHPAVWWISANVRNERENCCDDIAVQMCGNSLAYVKALVTLEEIKPRPSLAMAFSGKRNQLLNRVKRILNQPQNKSNIMEKFTATCLLLAVVLVLSVSANNGITNEPEVTNENAQKNEVVESIPEVDAQPKQEIVIKEVPIVADTLPKQFQGSGNYAYAKDGETLQMKYEDGEIINLKINGEKIPKEDFDKYHNHVVELLERTPPPPMPPSPMIWNDEIVVPVAPPVAPVAPVDVMDFHTSGRKSIVSTDEEGNRVIIIENEDGSDSKVIVQNGIVTLDGEVFSFDDFDDNVNIQLPNFDVLSLSGNAIVFDDNFDIAVPPMPPMPDFPDLNFDIDGLNFAENFQFNFDTIPPELNFKFNDNIFEFDKNLTEEEKEEIRETLREAKEEYREAIRELKENKREVMEEYRERLAEVREEQQEVMREQLAEVQEVREEQREAMRRMQEEVAEVRQQAREEQREAMQEARELAEEARQNVREQRTEARAHARTQSRSTHSNNSWKKSFVQQMKQDGFVKSNGDYDFKMKQNSLKINGQKQSSTMLNKYIQLYKQATDKDLGGKFSIKMTKDDSNQSTSISVDN